MRVLLVTHRDTAYDPNRYTNELVVALGEAVDLTIVLWENMAAPSVSAAAAGVDFDAVVVYVRFRHLLTSAPFDWSGFHGRRVWFEQDAWHNYNPGMRAWMGRFPAVYRRDGFHRMIVPGRLTRDLLRADGVDAWWVPKGFNSLRFHDLGTPRRGVCTYSLNWPSRRAMFHRLDLADVSGPYATLNDRLNQHIAAVVCNLTGRPPFGKVGRQVAKVWPRFTTIRPAIEPMIKTFEVAASGAALVVDYLDELQELGFIHGDTCLTYRTLDEAADLLRVTSDRDFKEIGRRGALLAHERHTWRHRAPEVVAALGP